MPRLSTKADSRFFEFIAMGAVGARAVCHHLEQYGHHMVELEHGSTDTKIWKDVKRKRVRIPDLVCTKCGLRIESRAKRSPALSMSHSGSVAERAWDFGMVDEDVVAFPILSTSELVWNKGQLRENKSYWHNRERMVWTVEGRINYFRVGDFRKTVHSRASTKGATEGSETSITWDAIFSTRKGLVEKVIDNKIGVRRESDKHLYTWQNRKNLPPVVDTGDVVEECQVIASEIPPVDEKELWCPNTLPAGHILHLLNSPERTQRFTGIKLARLNGDQQYESRIQEITSHPDKDIYVKLGGAIYLVQVCDHSTRELLDPYLTNPDEQIRLEAVVALAEAATPESIEILSGILDDTGSAFYIQSAAAWALGRIGTDAAIERLVQAFSDVREEIREKSHPARFPAGLPEFFIKFLTEPGDLVIDIFSGSNTTGYVAEQLQRRWLSVELDRRFAWLSAIRFMENWDSNVVNKSVEMLRSGELVDINEMAKHNLQAELPLPFQKDELDD